MCFNIRGASFITTHDQRQCHGSDLMAQPSVVREGEMLVSCTPAALRVDLGRRD